MRPRSLRLGWRLADVRRVLGLAADLPDLRRVDLETNYRCPRPVVERAVRLVEGNRERFAKRILPGPSAAGRLVLAPDAGDETERIEHVLATWPDDGTSRAILARTGRELLPAAAVALELGIPFRAARVPLLLEDDRLGGLLDDAEGTPTGQLLVRLGGLRSGTARSAAGVGGDRGRRRRYGNRLRRRRGSRPTSRSARLGGWGCRGCPAGRPGRRAPGLGRPLPGPRDVP